jgi:hypothetical protein
MVITGILTAGAIFFPFDLRQSLSHIQATIRQTIRKYHYNNWGKRNTPTSKSILMDVFLVDASSHGEGKSPGVLRLSFGY